MPDHKRCATFVEAAAQAAVVPASIPEAAKMRRQQRVAGDLKRIYTSVTVEEAERELVKFGA